VASGAPATTSAFLGRNQDAKRIGKNMVELLTGSGFFTKLPCKIHPTTCPCISLTPVVRPEKYSFVWPHCPMK
jgi:hypothetical protein